MRPCWSVPAEMAIDRRRGRRAALQVVPLGAPLEIPNLQLTLAQRGNRGGGEKRGFKHLMEEGMLILLAYVCSKVS